MWQLIINGPGYFDTTYDLPDGATTLGRADENDIVLSGDLVSRRHARMFVRGDDLTVEDLGSRNGCRVNSEAVISKRLLRPGDTVAIGENQLGIRQPATVESARTEVVDSEAGGVRRFGEGVNIEAAVIFAKDVSNSVLLRILDNAPATTDLTGEIGMSPLGATVSQAGPVSFDSLLLLYKTAERLGQAESLQSFLDEITDRLMQRVHAVTAVVLLRHSSGALVPAAVRHRGKLDKGEVPVSDAVVNAALEQGKALVVANVRGDARFASRESVVLYGVDQVLCVPIGRRWPFAGVLYLNTMGQAESEVESLLDLCTAVGYLVAAGVEKFERAEPNGNEVNLRRALGRFHAPDIVERRVAELRQSENGRATALEQRPVTVLWAELSSFTRLSEKLTPEGALEILNEFYARMMGVIFSFEGTVARFCGDGVLVVFGAPYRQPDDAVRAVRAAVAMKQEWAKANSRRAERERCELKAGISSGPALTGMLGTQARLDFTVLGHTVNLATWLGASASAGQILITPPTQALLGSRFQVEDRVWGDGGRAFCSRIRSMRSSVRPPRNWLFQ